MLRIWEESAKFHTSNQRLVDLGKTWFSEQEILEICGH